MILIFEVFAGKMFCGMLLIYPGGVHLFQDREGEFSLGTGGVPVAKVKQYKQLNLKRCTI